MTWGNDHQILLGKKQNQNTQDHPNHEEKLHMHFFKAWKTIHQNGCCFSVFSELSTIGIFYFYYQNKKNF